MNDEKARTDNPWTARTIKEIMSKVFRLAAEDLSFRRRCLEDGDAAIREVSGLELPEAAPRFRFVERVEEVQVALPPLARATSELSDEDLALVAGGLSKAEAAQAKQKEEQECLKILSLVQANVLVTTAVVIAAVTLGEPGKR